MGAVPKLTPEEVARLDAEVFEAAKSVASIISDKDNSAQEAILDVARSLLRARANRDYSKHIQGLGDWMGILPKNDADGRNAGPKSGVSWLDEEMKKE